MAGIACGIEDRCQLGDILVTSYTWEYDAGKVKRINENETIVENDHMHIILEPHLKELFIKLEADKSYLSEIQNKWKGNDIDFKLKMHFGPFPSGSKVVADLEVIKSIQIQQRKVIGFDMETYAAFYICEYFSLPIPKPISIKSVQDFGVPKNDKFRTYAAFTSANYIYEFVINNL